MKDFDNMISGWKSQPVPKAKKASEIISLARERLKNSRKKHLITSAVLGLTLLVVITYALTVEGDGLLFMTGIGLMIASLLVRILIEWNSLVSLNKINIGEITNSYLTQLKGFYKKRRKIQGSVTVVLFGAYIVGFLLLTPLFKQAMSSGLFIYIIVSGPVILAVLAYFIWKKVREELRNLEEAVCAITEVLNSIE
jgi:Na+/proline symporter